MAGTVHHKAYKKLLTALVEARTNKGLSQAKLAEALKKPPSFVAKYELAERRLDVIELLVILRVLEVEKNVFLEQFHDQLPKSL